MIDPPHLAPVAHEFLVVQSEFYLGPHGRSGDYVKMLHGQPDAVVFNGYLNQYLFSPLQVQAGQRIRTWVPCAYAGENARFFAEPLPGRDEPIGSPGGAAKLGVVGSDTPLVAALPRVGNLAPGHRGQGARRWHAPGWACPALGRPHALVPGQPDPQRRPAVCPDFRLHSLFLLAGLM